MFDAQQYGTLLHGLRYVRGYKNGKDFAELVSRLSGQHISERTLWAIERGDQEAKASQHFAFCDILRPVAGFFEESYTREAGNE